MVPVEIRLVCLSLSMLLPSMKSQPKQSWTKRGVFLARSVSWSRLQRFEKALKKILDINKMMN
jgi:hypothetical protein